MSAGARQRAGDRSSGGGRPASSDDGQRLAAARDRRGEGAGGVAVSLRDVTKRYEDVVAVDSVELDVRDGEFFSLLGPSGCGKTTTLRLIAGLEFPTEGTVHIFDEEVGLTPPNQRPVNTVFQSYALFPHKSVAENVAFGLQMRKVARDEIDERVQRALSLVQLGEMGDRRPEQLSGGQQQRVALARALVNEPKVLLLDEPLGALDLKLRQAMQLELKSLQSQVGITFIYVTHDQEEALTMSDRIGVMNGGRLLQIGTPEEIYEQPADRFVADFIGETSFLEGRTVGPDEVELEGGVRVATGQHGLDTETPVTLALRPERLELATSEDETAGRNGMEGQVGRATYSGTTTNYEVETPAGPLLVRSRNIPGVTHAEPGDRVRVTWGAEAAQVLPDVGDDPVSEPEEPPAPDLGASEER